MRLASTTRLRGLAGIGVAAAAVAAVVDEDIAGEDSGNVKADRAEARRSDGVTAGVWESSLVATAPPYVAAVDASNRPRRAAVIVRRTAESVPGDGDGDVREGQSADRPQRPARCGHLLAVDEHEHRDD